MTSPVMVANENFAEFAAFERRVIAERAAIPADYAGRPDLISSVVKSVAILPITGMIGKEAMMEWFGGTSLDLLTVRLAKLVTDPNVSHIVLNVNSPGGYVTAVEQTAALIRQAAAIKPIFAFVQGTAASAAYWLASAANKVYTDGETARVGSIGVYASFMDYSVALDKAGVTPHEFVTGKYKALGSPLHAPSADEKAAMQDNVDQLFTFFINAVSTYRNISKDTVLKSADGKVFFAADAAARNLTDGQLTLQEILTMTDLANKDAATAATMQEELNVTKTALAKAQADLAAATAAVRAATVTSAEQATSAASVECNTLYATNLGRDATAEEKAAYVNAAISTRVVIKDALESVTATRVATGAKLLGEQATVDQTAAAKAESAEANLLVAAAKRVLGNE